MPSTRPLRDPFLNELDAFLNKHRRLWSERFFRGVVQTVGKNGYTWVCTVAPTAPPTIGVGSIVLACAMPGYVPTVNDVVECIWRDETSGWVLWPVTGVVVVEPTRATPSGTVTPAANTFSKVPLNTVGFGNSGYWDLTNNRFVAPFQGEYRVDWSVGFGTSASAFTGLSSVYVNGTDTSRGNNAPNSSISSLNPVSVGTDVFNLNKGDYLELWATTTAGGIATLADSKRTKMAVTLVNRKS